MWEPPRRRCLHRNSPPPPGADAAAAQGYSPEQLDALLAPVALYPDALLTQTLMATAYPLQVVEASRWVDDPANKGLTGPALDQALSAKDWDPSVKSLVPFPQVLAMLNAKLDWTQQVGWAMGAQQADVWASVQRLRQQAYAAGNLRNTDQQVVTTQDQAIVIEPAQPNVVYVPVYNPTVVYGSWAYPAYPPVYLPPPPGYAVGAAIFAGFAFGAAVAINNSLWGWARPHWGYGGYGGGYVNVNVNRYNTININRTQITNNYWRPGGPGYRPPGGGYKPPPGPVGPPHGGRPGGNGGSGGPNNPGNRPGGGGGLNPNNPGGRPGGNGGGLGPNNPGNRPGGNGGGLNPNNPGGRPGGNGGGGGPNNPGNRPGGNGGGFNPNNPGGRPGGNGGGLGPNNPGNRPGGNGGGLNPNNPGGRPRGNGGGGGPNNPGNRPGGNGGEFNPNNPGGRPGGNGGGLPPGNAGMRPAGGPGGMGPGGGNRPLPGQGGSGSGPKRPVKPKTPPS